MAIGFERFTYHVTEGADSVQQVCAVIITTNCNIRTPVSVHVHTVDDSAGDTFMHSGLQFVQIERERRG